MINSVALLLGILKQLKEDKVIDVKQYNSMVKHFTQSNFKETRDKTDKM